ncbi:hypothetical protein ACB092_05G236900 [Castanea dentata]
MSLLKPSQKALKVLDSYESDTIKLATCSLARWTNRNALISMLKEEKHQLSSLFQMLMKHSNLTYAITPLLLVKTHLLKWI